MDLWKFDDTATRIAADISIVDDPRRTWRGKGMNAAGLNFGDCFAYEVAKENDCPLLYVGDDFTRTDVKRAF